MKILVVDDNINDRDLLFGLLTAQGYEVTCASNGVEALEKIRESKPDLVISDIMMPQMDGFGLCRELKKTMETIKIPIILYSSSFTDLEDEKLVLKESASAYIRKPFEIKSFLEKIREVITVNRAGKISQSMPGILDEKEYLSLY
jgi:CheY-like chemotaxis protein